MCVRLRTLSGLATGLDQFGEDIRERMLAPALAGQVESLPGLIITPFAIDNRSTDLEQLQLLGEAASELQIPLLISTSPAFIQFDVGAGMDAMPYPGGLLSRPEYDKWIALRKKDASRWFSLCCNRFLLRPPYTVDQRNTLGLTESIHRRNDHL